MSIIKNKDIYDSSQGNPLEPLYKYLDILDEKLKGIGADVNKFQTELREVSKTGTGEELKKITEGVTKLKTETEKYSKVNEARVKTAEQIQKTETQLVSLYDKEAQQLAEVKLELQERRAELKKTAKENKVAKDSIVGLNIQLSKLRQGYDKLSKEQRENQAIGGKLLGQIQALDSETKQLTATTGRHQKSVGNYPGLFGKTTVSLKGLGTELLAAGGIVGGVQLLIEGFKAFTAQVGKNIEVTKKLNASFNLGSREARLYAGDLIAIADTFDQDYNEVAQAAISVSKQLGISVGEATGLIEEGFLKGSNNSGEFLDILKEYPAQFKAAGIDADQAFAIINQQVTEGIYSDKGVDAIKEGGLRLRENTKAVQDALAPLDASVRKQIEQEVAAGRSFEAIKLVSEALNDTSLTAAETQAIIADVFGGPGEDAGLEYLQTLKDIDANLDNVSTTASEAEQSNLNLSKSWNSFIAGVSASDGIFSKVFSTFKDLLAGAINSLTLLIDKVQGGESAISALDRTVARLRATQQAQANAEVANIKKTEAAEAAAEAKRKERYAAYRQRQIEIAREQARQLVASNKKITQAAKEAETIEENHEKELELLEEMAEAREEDFITITDQEEVLKSIREKDAADLAANLLAIEEDYNEQRKTLMADIAEFSAQTLVGLIADGELSIKSFGKFIITTALDIAEKLLLIAIAETVAKQIASKGFAGIATSAVLVGLIKGTFAGIKSAVQNFAEGTEYVHGPGTGTSDSIQANLSKGERVMTAKQNHELNGISNDDVVTLTKLGKSVSDIPVHNESKMLEKLDRLGLAYKKGGYWYIERGNGHVEKFKE